MTYLRPTPTPTALRLTTENSLKVLTRQLLLVVSHKSDNQIQRITLWCVGLGLEVGVRYLLGRSYPNTYLLENPLYIEVSALLR